MLEVLLHSLDTVKEVQTWDCVFHGQMRVTEYVSPVGSVWLDRCS